MTNKDMKGIKKQSLLRSYGPITDKRFSHNIIDDKLGIFRLEAVGNSDDKPAARILNLSRPVDCCSECSCDKSCSHV